MRGININLYDYVNNYFQKNFPESYILIPDSLVEFKIDEEVGVKQDYVRIFLNDIQSKYNMDDIKDGKLDLEIDKILNSFVDKYFTSSMRKDCFILYDYVRMFLVKKGVGSKFSSDIFDHIVKSIVARVWSQYSRNRLNTDDFNHIIDLIYNNIYNQYIKMINDRIEQLMNYNFDIVNLGDVKIDKNQLEGFVAIMISKRESREFLGRLSKLKIKPDASLSRTGIELNTYIKQYILLLKKSKIQTEDISPKKVTHSDENTLKQDTVKTEDCLNNIRDNSVKRENVPDKIKVNKNTKNVEKMVMTLAILAILSINAVSINQYVNQRINEANDRNAITRVEILDGFNYSNRLRNNDYYNDIAKNIIKVYSKMGQIDNENYKTLCIYEAYEGSSGLSEMEDIFRILRKRVVEDDVKLNLRNVIRADSEQTYFYLDFVYDQLNDMGFEEVNSQEYQDALFKYKYANFGNYYGVVGVTLTNEQKAIIKDVMTKYEESCKKNKLEFGYFIEDGNYSFTASYTASSGKGL